MSGNRAEAKSEFLAAMRAAGIEPYAELDLLDGERERFRVVGDKPGSKNGWAILYGGPVPAGSFGSWKTGVWQTWRSRDRRPETPKERRERRKLLELDQRARAEESARRHAVSRERAAKLWLTARPAADDHPYLRTKGVHAFGLRQLRDMLVVPCRDVHGTLHTLQFIGPDGTKRFLTGGRIEGCYFSIGRPCTTLYLAEGYASGATVHQATGDAVAVCFSCGNLKSVAIALREKFPELAMVIAADNDEATPGNPGVTRAFEAAAAAGALVAIPNFVQVSV